MFSSDSNFRRRVSVSHKHGGLVVRIARHNHRASSIFVLIGFTAGFVFFLYIFISPLFRRSFSSDAVYILPFLAFVVMWYVVGIRGAIWRAFGVEQITVEGGVLYWTRTALFWVRKVEVPTKEITEVKAITPWHALGNHVELTANNQRRVIVDMLLRDETTQLADQLKHAVGLFG
jgi:hypothetical protein